MLYIVKYSGVFAFIKPWTAARDSKTKSCDYLTTSILMGIERKLFPELLIDDNGKLNKILRHRLSFQDVSFQQEATLSYSKENPIMSTVSRGLLLNPELYLMFDNEEDAEISNEQHIYLCRNEDILLPLGITEIKNEIEFDKFDEYFGYESFSCDRNDYNSIYCGLNKYTNDKQYIFKKIFGVPKNLV
jgi:hypothetical protein